MILLWLIMLSSELIFGLGLTYGIRQVNWLLVGECAAGAFIFTVGGINALKTLRGHGKGKREQDHH
jgi:hypothetical protein